MADEKNRNVAKDEYAKYIHCIDTYVGPLLEELFPKDLIECALEYTKMDECEHFEWVISFNSRMFTFAWAYNELRAQRNWLYDLQPYGLFIPPEHIMPESVLTFNEWPHRMFQLAKLHDDYELLEDKNEDEIVASFRYCATTIIVQSTCPRRVGERMTHGRDIKVSVCTSEGGISG